MGLTYTLGRAKIAPSSCRYGKLFVLFGMVNVGAIVVLPGHDTPIRISF